MNIDVIRIAKLFSSLIHPQNCIAANMSWTTKTENKGYSIWFMIFSYVRKPYGTPHPNYVCVKCGKTGHWVHNCPNSDGTSSHDRLKRPTGIPFEHMMVVKEALPGSYLTHSGQYAVPKIDV